jgi:sugar lactone lactonase YvrE
MLARSGLRRLSIALMTIGGVAVVFARGATQPTNSAPNPYHAVDGWAKLPDGRAWGSTSAVGIARDGHVWVAERCGANSCAGSNVAPIVELDQSGKPLRQFGQGLFVFPHGFFVDADGNIWVTDAQGKDGKGHQVLKFSPEGKVLLTLGKAGVAGNQAGEFNQPSDVVVGPNGDIFVADGHDPESNHRIVKFSRDGKFIKTWGKKGSAHGEFNTPHALAFDSKGRLFVADRENNRIQIFDQEGAFIAEWKQFSRPSGIDIDRNDVIYVADSESNKDTNPGWKRGIRIGSAKDGTIAAFIPDPEPNPDKSFTSGAEGVAVDTMGNVYGAEVGPKMLRRYSK